MGFFEGFLEGLKDVGTSTVRIVTDTAIDIGNVATGFQFNDEMENAKKTMSDAGVLSHADAIEKNHYGFLKDMEQEVKVMLDRIAGLNREGQALEQNRDERFFVLEELVNDIQLLAQLSNEAQALFEKARSIPEFDRWAEFLDIDIRAFQTVNASVEKWNKIGDAISIAGLSADATSGTLAAISGLSGLAKASTLLRATKATKLTSTLSKGSKFIKIGKIAGRASAILAVATIGLDVGLSIIQLEERKAQLEEQIRNLRAGLNEATDIIAEVREELRTINLRINEVLHSVNPPQVESSWENWVVQTKNSLQKLRDELISFESTKNKILELTRSTRGQSLEQRIGLIMSVDPDISREEAQKIIDQADGAQAGKEAAAVKTPGPIRVTNQYVWLPEIHKLPLEVSCEFICGNSTDEFIPCFSQTRAQWGQPTVDALSWYLSPHRDDFTFRTKLFGGFPNVQRLSTGIKPVVGRSYQMSCRISPTEAIYSIDGKPYAKASYANGTVPAQGQIGFAIFNAMNIVVKNIAVLAV